MDNANVYYEQQTYSNTCSDGEDSTSFPSFPWFPENNRRRKSRLGTHRHKIRRFFPEASSNDGDHSSSNKENIHDGFPSPTSLLDPATTETRTKEPTPSIFYDDGETPPLSLARSNFNNQTSTLLQISRALDDERSPLVTSFEKSRTAASSYPSFLVEDEIDGILGEVNSSDDVGTLHFPLSSRSNKTCPIKFEKSFDASVSSVITNHIQTAETKPSEWFFARLSDDVSSIPAVEDLSLAPSEQLTNYEPVDSECPNSVKQRFSSTRSTYSTNSLLNNSVSQPVIENNNFHYVNSNSAVRDLDSKNCIKSSDNISSEPITESCSLDCTNSIEALSNSLHSRNQFSDPPLLPIKLSSMRNQENAVGFQNPGETNSKSSLNPSLMLDQENCFDSQYLKENPNLPVDLSSMQKQDNRVEFQNLHKMNFSFQIDGSSIRDKEIPSPAELSNNLPSSIEVDEVLLKTERQTVSMSISSLAEIPSTVKSQRVSIPFCGIDRIDKIDGSSAVCDSNLEQKKPSTGEHEILPHKTAAVMPASEAPKPTVQFAEPAVVKEFAVPRNSSKIPAAITVKGKTYKVLNILGSGGSSVVFQVSDPEMNELLALKKVDLPDEDDEITDGYLNEVQMLENLQNCDVIIRIFDHQLVCKNGKKTLHVVMEKGDTDLSSLIKSVNESKKLSIPMIIYYWTEMLAAVNEVHRRGIIHSDLKPANFVLVRGRLKLIDFGIASSVQGDVTSVYKDFFCGTLNYMSPEAISYVECPSGGAGYKVRADHVKLNVRKLNWPIYNNVEKNAFKFSYRFSSAVMYNRMKPKLLSSPSI